MVEKMIIRYLLTEEGRKQSLLTGGNGKDEQQLEAPITKELLEFAQVNYKGEAVLDIAHNVYLNPKNLSITHDNTSVNFPNNKREYVTKFRVNESCQTPGFDQVQTVESISKWFFSAKKAYNQRKEELQKEVDQKNVNYETELNQFEEKAKIAFECWEKEKAEKEAQEKAERQAKEQEKINWINEFGSEYLKKAIELGYDCQRQYILERAAREYPDFEIDFEDNIEFKGRSCPSEKAINEVLRLKNESYIPFVVWLTTDIFGHWEKDGEFESCEAILIEKYLGSKYYLVKTM